MTNDNLFSRFIKCLGLIIFSSMSFNSVFANVPNPIVIGPIVCGQNAVTCVQPSGLPQNSQTINSDFAASGHQEQEFFIQGNATSYTSTPKLASGETTRVVFECFKQWLETYGIPLAVSC